MWNYGWKIFEVTGTKPGQELALSLLSFTGMLVVVGYGSTMKQAQAMQDNLKKAQDELGSIEVEGQSGAGLVKVTMTCKHDVKRIVIDPSLLADDKDMLEDLVAAAFNDGLRRAEEVSQEKMGRLTAGMPLPPGMKFPF